MENIRGLGKPSTALRLTSKTRSQSLCDTGGFYIYSKCFGMSLSFYCLLFYSFVCLFVLPISLFIYLFIFLFICLLFVLHIVCLFFSFVYIFCSFLCSRVFILLVSLFIYFARFFVHVYLFCSFLCLFIMLVCLYLCLPHISLFIYFFSAVFHLFCSCVYLFYSFVCIFVFLVFLFRFACSRVAAGADGAEQPVKPKRKKPGTAIKRKVQPIAVDEKGAPRPRFTSVSSTIIPRARTWG